MRGFERQPVTARRSMGHVRCEPQSWNHRPMHGAQKTCRAAQPGRARGCSIVPKQMGQAVSSSAMFA